MFLEFDIYSGEIFHLMCLKMALVPPGRGFLDHVFSNQKQFWRNNIQTNIIEIDLKMNSRIRIPIISHTQP